LSKNNGAVKLLNIQDHHVSFAMSIFNSIHYYCYISSGRTRGDHAKHSIVPEGAKPEGF
jgi:hypothetical protein